MKRLIAVGLAVLLIAAGTAGVLAQSDELIEGDAREFDTPPDLIVYANVESEAPPADVEITDSGDITRDAESITLTEDGQWIEAAITSDEVTTVGVQFWGDDEGGWARVMVDGRSVWRGSTHGDDAEWPGGAFVRYLQITDLEPGSHTVHVEATGRMGKGGGDDVTVAFFGFSPVSTAVVEPTATPVPEEEPSGEVAFADDFEDPESGWATDDRDEGWMDYVDGTFAIYAEKETTILWSDAGQSFKDVVVAVEATLVDGPRNDNVGFGVGCRMNVEDDTGYLFLISGDGYYSIIRSDPTEYVTLEDWTETDAVEQGNVLNQIAATCKGDQLSLTVNGEEVVSIQDDTYAEGDLGLAAVTFESTAGEVHFDNLTASVPTAESERAPARRRHREPVLPTPAVVETETITETEGITEGEVISESEAATATETITTPEVITSTEVITKAEPEIETEPETATISIEDVVAGWEDFDSFRLSIDFGVESEQADGSTVTQSVAISVASVTEPLAQEVIVSGAATNEEDNFDASATQIDDTLYTIDPDGACTTEPATDPILSDPDTFGEAFTMLDEFGTLVDVQRVMPNVEIGGVEAEHYVFDANSLPDAGDEVSELSGEIYLAVDDGYLLRFAVAGEGTLNMAFMSDVTEGAGSFHLDYELGDINQPIAISAPSCESKDGGGSDGGGSDTGGAASPYPLPDDATEVVVAEGSTNFQTSLSVSEATDFYMEEMPKAGWTYVESDSMVMGALSLLSFTRGEEAIEVTIFGGEDANSIVVITPAE